MNRRGAVEMVRGEAIRRLWFKILGRTVYRRLVLMECRLDRSLPTVIVPAETVVELLTPADVDDYRRLRPDTAADEVRRRLACGHWCFVIRQEGRIVHAGWVASQAARIDYLETEIALAPGDAYQYDSYTASDVRGRNVAAVRVAAMARHLREAGHRRLIAAVLPENAAAFRPLLKSGYRRLGVVGVLRIGPYRRTFRRERHEPSPGDASAEHDY